MACDFPITIKNPARKLNASVLSHIPVPCGKCPTCLTTRVNGWVFRLLQHEKISSSAHFVTLTYGTNEQPLGHVTPNGHKTLVKSDFQKFMKILRNQYRTRVKHPITNRYKYDYSNVPNIKYFACGEYGTRRQRPHFHAIIYNADAHLIERSWSHGFVHIGTVTGASIAYTLKYMHKPKTVFAPGDDRLPEFQLVSQRLGKNYVTPQSIAWHRSDLSRLYVVAPGGQKYPMPRYYRNLLYTEAQRAQQARNAQKLQSERQEQRLIDFFNIHRSLDNFYRYEVERKHAYLSIWRERSTLRNLQF